MKQLQKRIIRLLKEGSIKDIKEQEKLEFLLKTKKWNPYCIRHSAITSDSDYLPEYALKKKVRWSMNSRQGYRYIERRMGDELKDKILIDNGFISSEIEKKKPSILNCPICNLINAFENKYCSKCIYPLKPEAYDEIKKSEETRITELETKYQQDMDDFGKSRISLSNSYSDRESAFLKGYTLFRNNISDLYLFPIPLTICWSNKASVISKFLFIIDLYLIFDLTLFLSKLLLKPSGPNDLIGSIFTGSSKENCNIGPSNWIKTLSSVIIVSLALESCLISFWCFFFAIISFVSVSISFFFQCNEPHVDGDLANPL